MSKLLNPPPKQQSIVERGVKPNTLRFVDDTLTRLAGGHSTPYGEFPFETADDYYAYGGSVSDSLGVCTNSTLSEP